METRALGQPGLLVELACVWPVYPEETRVQVHLETHGFLDESVLLLPTNQPFNAGVLASDVCYNGARGDTAARPAR